MKNLSKKQKQLYDLVLEAYKKREKFKIDEKDRADAQVLVDLELCFWVGDYNAVMSYDPRQFN